MPSFKPKANKKINICKKYNNTLDSKHNEFVKQFEKDENVVIPNLKKERYYLKKKLEAQEEAEYEKNNIEEIMEIKDRIIEINELIKQLKNQKINYYLDNSKYIFEYFKNKKNINNIKTEDEIKINSKNQLLFDFFKVKQKPNPNSQNPNEKNPNEKNPNEKNPNEKNQNEKNPNENILKNNDTTQNLVQKYLRNIDNSFLDMKSFVKETNICQYCFKGEMIPLDDEGVLICNLCATSIPYLIENEKPSYKEPPKEVCFYAYKKINHFKEVLAQFQGKETTQIPDEVIEQIHQQIKKERLTISDLTYETTKDILKKLSFNKFYEHIPFIKNKLGIPPPVLSNELEETLCNLFMEIQTPYAKMCPDYRQNFLHYNYVLFKFCELLDERKYLNDIPLLKDREKIIEQDETWKKMCYELNWEFIPTV
jgi:hypothetical protein